MEQEQRNHTFLLALIYGHKWNAEQEGNVTEAVLPVPEGGFS